MCVRERASKFGGIVCWSNKVQREIRGSLLILLQKYSQTNDIKKQSHFLNKNYIFFSLSLNFPESNQNWNGHRSAQSDGNEEKQQNEIDPMSLKFRSLTLRKDMGKSTLMVSGVRVTKRLPSDWTSSMSAATTFRRFWIHVLMSRSHKMRKTAPNTATNAM